MTHLPITTRNFSFSLLPMNRLNIALLGFLAIIGFFLVTEHWAHLYGYLPYLLLFAMIPLHLFGHGGHGGHGSHNDGETPKKKPSSSSSHHHHE